MSEKDFKYLVEKFGPENLELWKQKVYYPYEYMNSFEIVNEVKLPTENIFIAL